MNNNEKKYFELEKEYRSELKKLNNKQNKIIALFVIIFFVLSVLLFFVKIYFFAIIYIILSFACYVVFYLLYEDSLKNALKGKANKIFKGKNKIENLTNFEEYLDGFLKENEQENKYNLPLISGGIAYFSYDYGRKFENIKSKKFLFLILLLDKQ